jgi:hypothetical protein
MSLTGNSDHSRITPDDPLLMENGPMTDAENQDYPPDNRISDAEWANRRLCVDGNCIGVIGPDGRCKECGRPAGENLTPSASEDALSDVPRVAVEGDEPPPAAKPPADNDEIGDADSWENRRLCPDGNCIGVIGPDGYCKECGKPAEDR